MRKTVLPIFSTLIVSSIFNGAPSSLSAITRVQICVIKFPSPHVKYFPFSVAYRLMFNFKDYLNLSVSLLLHI